MARRLTILLAVLALTAGLLPVQGLASPGDAGTADTGPADTDLYVVELADPPLATYEGGIAGLLPTAPLVTGERIDVDDLAVRAYRRYLRVQQDAFLAAAGTELGRSIDVAHHYDAVLNGLAVELRASEVLDVAQLPGVTRIVADREYELHTDAGPEWIGAPEVWDGSATAAGEAGTTGEGVVVGIIDTGINPWHESFAEAGPVDGHVHENPRDRYFGLCDPVTGLPYCNDKLIGVWDFTGEGPIDVHSHGSHVAATAAGNIVDAEIVAPTMTVDTPLSGVAPHANIISYNGCCLLTALIAAINQTVLDQVDVVNFSIGGASSNPWLDTLALPFLNARLAGVFVATSAGNSGPGPATVGSPGDAPWILTVGASTHDRSMSNALVDLAGGSATPPADIVGASLTAGLDPAPIVYAGDYGHPNCGEGTLESPSNPFEPGTFDGEIVVCDRGGFARVDMARHVAEGGAGGFVLANDEASGDSIVADAFVIPGVGITHEDGLALKAWLAEGEGHTGAIAGTSFATDPADGDVMAGFSSRGPNASVGGVLKPDVTAPGVDILAAYAGTEDDPDVYGAMSGTSMSSPHAAGAAALVVALRPEWTPDEVRSALMTTSFTAPPGTGGEVEAVRKHDAATPADAFDKGAGRIDLRSAARAGLVLDVEGLDYLAANPLLGGDPRTLNVPSLADDACEVTCSWTRTLHSSAETEVSWTVQTTGDVPLEVEPASFTLAPGDGIDLTVTADASGVAAGQHGFGRIVLVPDVEEIPLTHLPVAVGAAGDPIDAIDRLTLHMRGNVEDGCTGQGNLDLAACDGPFLSEDGDLSTAPAARFVTSSLVDGGSARNEIDPNWVWRLDEPVTLEGPMDLTWWASCSACTAVLAENFDVRLFADGELMLDEEVDATALLPGVATRYEARVDLPRIEAADEVVVQITPIWIDTQTVTIIHYDSELPCPAAADTAPCDSFVEMPVVVEEDEDESDLPDLVVGDITATSPERRGGPPADREPATITATIANVGDGDASSTETLVTVTDEDGEQVHTATAATEPVPAGGVEEVTVEWPLPNGTGEYTITVVANHDAAVEETDHGNNAASETVTIRGGRIVDGDGGPPGRNGEQPQAAAAGPSGAAAVPIAGSAPAGSAVLGEQRTTTGLAAALLLLMIGLHTVAGRRRPRSVR